VTFTWAGEIPHESHRILTGQIITLKAVSPVRVVVVRPKVLEVEKVTSSSVDLIGKEEGQTLVEILDAQGKKTYRIEVLAEDMEELREKVDNLLHRDLQLEGVMTRLNLLNNKIILTGEVSKEDLDKVNLVLEPFSGRIENLLGEKQELGTIEIEVELIELQTGATKSLGISLPGALSIGEAESSFLGGEGITEPRTSSTALFNVLGYSRTALGATMDFLIQEGKARILSKPRLACQSGKEAELMVGGEKPIMTTTVGEGGGEGTNVSYKSYGIQLKIAPEIVENRRRIHLNLEVEVSETLKAETIGDPNAPTAQAYPIITRSTKTELTLNNGQTLSISGLIKQKKEEDIRKIAFLGDLPIIGSLFRKKEVSTGDGAGGRGDTELVVFLTPRIIEEEETEEQKPVNVKTITPLVPRRAGYFPPALAEYINRVKGTVLNSLLYPRTAKDAGWQGSLKISIHLSSQGDLLGARILESSGYNIFDDNTIKLIKELSPYPPFPPQVEAKEVWIDIPVVYRLD